MLKADFHIHTSEDPYDTWISYSAKELINRASRLGFNVLAITNHSRVTYNKKLANHAKDKGILLIPGIETWIQGKEVIILNAPKQAEKIRTFDELRRLKKTHPSSCILAPHPFYPKKEALQKSLSEHIDLFDGIEYCHYYCRLYNPYNKKAIRKAKKHNKPLIGTSDSHQVLQFNKTYSLIDADMDVDSVIDAMKQNKVKLRTRPLSYMACTRVILPMMRCKVMRLLLHPTKHLQ